MDEINYAIGLINAKMSENNGFIDTSSRGSLIINRIINGHAIDFREEVMEYMDKNYVFHSLETKHHTFSGYTTITGYYNWIDYLISMNWIKM